MGRGALPAAPAVVVLALGVVLLRLLPPLPDCLFDFGAPRLATASVKL
jgi:hypothetical protein